MSGIAVGFLEGAAVLSLEDETIAPGVRVVALDLELLDVDYPLELAGGAERFQRHPTRMDRLELELDAAVLVDHLRQMLEARDSAFRLIDVEPELGLLTLEAAVGTAAGDVPMVATLAVSPDEGGRLRLLLDAERRFGALPPSLSLIASIADAIDALLATQPGGSPCELRGPGELRIDLISPVLWALLPSRGFKLPNDRDRPITTASITGARITIVASDLAPGPEALTPGVRRTMKILGRLDGAGPVNEIEPLLAAGDPVAAFNQLKAALDDTGGPEVVEERLLAIGAGDPRLHADCADLAADALARAPRSPAALLALAAIEVSEGDDEAAAKTYERVAAAFERMGERRAAGLAYYSAARRSGARSPQRQARLLELAVSLAPTSPPILAALVDSLVAAGRAAEAVRAARELARVAPGDDAKARAHVLAGDVLRTTLTDPVQAKRAYERALRLVPDHSDALEGLARAVVDSGDPRRSASILEHLINAAEAADDNPRAARLSVVLGDVWRPGDPSAALRRYRRALILEPDHEGALERLASVGVELGDPLVALQATQALLTRVDDVQRQVEYHLLAAKICADALDRAAEATEHLEAAKALAPASVEVLARLAEAYQRNGQVAKVDEVMGWWVEVLQAGDDIGGGLQVLVKRARLRHAAGMDPRPLQEGLQIAERDGGATPALLDAAIEIAELGGDYERAVVLLERRLRLDIDPDDRPKLLGRFGSALDRAGRRVDALRAHEEALELSPAHGPSLDAVRAEYRRRGDLDRLARILSTAAAALPPADRAGLLAERARVLVELGRGAAAFEAATEAGGDQLLALSTALALDLGRWEEARVLCERRRRSATSATPVERLAIELDRAQAAEGLGDASAVVAALGAALELSDRLDDGGRRWQLVAARLAEELDSDHRWRELAELERRRAGRQDLAPEERAGHLLVAADLWRRVSRDDRADADLERALELVSSADAPDSVRDELMARLERSARRSCDPRRIASMLDHRVRFAGPETDVLALRIEQVELLQQAGLQHQALAVLEAMDIGTLPVPIELVRRFAEVALSAQRHEVAARLYGRAAELAAGEDAIELYDRAAAAYLEAGEGALAVAHQRRRIELSPDQDPAVPKMLEGLEELARRDGDHSLLAWSLERRAAGLAEPADAAAAWFEAARVHSGMLGDYAPAIACASRAVAAAPADTVIRQFHLELLRAHGTIEDRVAALEAAADRTFGDEARWLLVEAAAALVPKVQDAPERAVARGLSLVRRAADRATNPAPALRKLAEYARRLDRVDDEIDSLDRLLQATDDDAERIVAHLRRVELIHTKVVDSVRAQAEWQVMMPTVDRLDERGRVRLAALLDDASYLAIKFDAEAPVRSALLLGLDLTEINESWDVHVGCLRRLLDLTQDPRVRADLHVALGEVEEWRRGQGDAAEREYLAGVAAFPDHDDSREALTSLYLAADRFGDLADHVGIDVLREAWDHFGAEGSTRRAVSAGEALWPRLPTTSDERAAVLLALADLYLADDEAEGAVMLLEQVRRHSPPHFRDTALDRLRQVFFEKERWDLYVEVLGRQAQRAEEPSERAQIMAEMGDTLEWKIGDGVGAEREYRSAVAADSACEPARRALADLLASQDRFDEIGTDVGLDLLGSTVADLLEAGQREARRARLAIAALAPQLPLDQRGAAWTDFAEKCAGSEDRRFALETAVRLPGEHRKQAFDALEVLLTDDEDASGRANLLRLRVETEEDVGAQVRFRLALAAVLGGMAADSDEVGREAFDGEVEHELLRVVQLEPGNVIASAGLKEMYVRQGLYSKVAEILGPDALRDTSDVSVAAQSAAGPQQSIAALRSALVESPRQPDLVESLARLLLEGDDPVAAVGPVAVARHLSRGSSLPFRLPPIIREPLDDDGLFGRLAAPAVRSPLGRVMAGTAMALASVLPAPMHATGATERRLCSLDDPSLDGITDDLRDAIADVLRLVDRPAEAKIDGAPTDDVVIEPGTPPAVVVPLSLATSVTTTELRFLVGQQVMLLRLGYLPALDWSGVGGVRTWLDLLCSLPRTDAVDRVPYELADAIELLRAKIDAESMALLEGLDAADTTQGDLDTWAAGVRLTANRFGLLVAGDLEVVTRRLAAADDDAITDLLGFLVGDDYLALIRALASVS